MDEGILCEVGKMDGSVVPRSRRTTDAQHSPDLYGDQQREREGLVERKQDWSGGGDHHLLSTSVDEVTQACCCHSSAQMLTMGHCTLSPSVTILRGAPFSTRLQAGALLDKLKWALCL